ncbi:transporter [Acidocella sp.]|uniref:transporter n=1 Tax=Acidocella sp. TaxID=50710 RepID=UPI003D05BBA4
MARVRLIASACFALACSFAPVRALAPDPWPGEAVQPPPDLNIVLYYNAFTSTGAYGESDGTVDGQHTRINVDLQVLRYIHTFNVANVLAGVQVYVPYVSFIGNQQVGQYIPAPAGLPAGTPAYGAGHATLSHEGGFGQPSFGAFFFPYSTANNSTNLVLGAWISPPIGSYNSNASLNYTHNLWTGELEAGFHTTLAGQPGGRNLALSLWGEAYFYGSNGGAGMVTPAIYANAIPPIYQLYHQIDPAVPASNPLSPQTVTPARFSMQPTEELRVYLPYEFFPKTRATIAPGFYQSFGGKGIYTLADGTKVDSGMRTNETQLRLILSTYLSRHWQVALNGEYDVMAHGGPLYRTIELRIGAAF